MKLHEFILFKEEVSDLGEFLKSQDFKDINEGEKEGIKTLMAYKIIGREMLHVFYACDTRANEFNSDEKIINEDSAYAKLFISGHGYPTFMGKKQEFIDVLREHYADVIVE